MTIIVMIILATAIILTLNGSGIIGKAKEAKTASDNASRKEAASLAYAEYKLGVQMGEIDGDKVTASKYVKDELIKDGISTTGIAVTEDGYIETGLSELSVKFVEAGIKVGAVVIGYDLSSNTTTSYETDGNENTAPNKTETTPTKQTIARGTELEWKYMGVDENGETLIVASSAGNLSKMTLSGKGGYLNGPSALKTVCEKLYSSNMGKARSMTWEDVTRVLKCDIHQGTYYELKGNEITTDKVLTIGELETELKTTLDDRETPDGTDIANYKSDYTTLYKGDINVGDEIKDIVYQAKPYWLASLCNIARFDLDWAYFRVRWVGKTTVGSYHMFDSANKSYSESYAVRPVVVLADDVEMSYDGTTVTLSK